MSDSISFSQSQTCLAYDIGGTKVNAAIINGEGEVLFKIHEPVNTSHRAHGFLNQLVKMGQALQKSAQFTKVGIASAGPLDLVKGTLEDPTNLKTDGTSWGRVPLRSTIEEAFGLPTFLENDAAAGALGEMWLGAGKQFAHMAYVTLGTGVGVGVIQNKKLWKVRDKFHPELSHLPLNIFDDNMICGCGRKGCAETYLAPRLALQRFCELEKLPTPEAWVEAARAGNGLALGAFQQYAAHLARFCNLLAEVVYPEAIILSGGFSKAHPLFLKQAEANLARLPNSLHLQMQILPSELQENAFLLGAAYMAFLTKD